MTIMLFWLMILVVALISASLLVFIAAGKLLDASQPRGGRREYGVLTMDFLKPGR